MTPVYLFFLPTWVWGLIVVAAVVAVGVGGLKATHHWIPAEVLERHNDVAGFIIAVVGVIYAVLLAFMTIAVWEDHGDAKEHTEREAAALLSAARDADAFAEPVRGEIRRRAVGYARLVVDEEWSAMAHERREPRADEALQSLWRAYLMVDPHGERESQVFAEGFSRLNQVAEERQLRLLASRDHVPPLLWTLLIVGGVITIAFCWLFEVPSLRTHALMVAGVAALTGLTLFVIAALDNPFAGDLRVEPDGMELVVERLAG